MKKILIIISALAVLTATAVIAFNSGNGYSGNIEGISELPLPVSKDSLVNRGKYMVSIMGCYDFQEVKSQK
jgi:hypothetical protein